MLPTIHNHDDDDGGNDGGDDNNKRNIAPVRNNTAGSSQSELLGGGDLKARVPCAITFSNVYTGFMYACVCTLCVLRPL